LWVIARAGGVHADVAGVGLTSFPADVSVDSRGGLMMHGSSPAARFGSSTAPLTAIVTAIGVAANNVGGSVSVDHSSGSTEIRILFNGSSVVVSVDGSDDRAATVTSIETRDGRTGLWSIPMEPAHPGTWSAVIKMASSSRLPAE